MASERLTIRLTPAASAIVGEGEGLSRRINDIAIRYGMIVQECRPTLSSAQWSAIFDALNGTAIDSETIAHIWMAIEDSAGLGDKWNTDQQRLVKELTDMDFAKLVAIAATAERYWDMISEGIESDRAMQLLDIPAEE